MKNGYVFPFQQNIIREIQPSYRHQTLGLSLDNQVVDRAMGCLFGSFIGDALGAYLQFAKEKDFQKMMVDVMDMPGGGVFALKPGQVTDDSQLAFHLLDQITHFKFQGDFKQEEASLALSIARGYLKWYESRPFDIGITCRKGLEVIRKQFEASAQLKAQKDYNKLNPKYATYALNEIHQKIKLTSGDSQSNGSLMRITPIPFFFSIFSDKKSEKDMINKQLGITKDLMKKFIHDEVKLLHPNNVLVDVGYIWAKLLRALIRRENNADIKVMYGHFIKEFQDNRIGWGKLSDEPIDARKNIGWAKIAVSLGLDSLNVIANKITKNQHFELNQDLFTKEMKYILSKGGDTDTNAAIVGGMLGSIVGFKNLPKKYLKTLMSLRHQQKSQPVRKQNRPTFYEPRYAFANAYRLLYKRLSQQN